MILFQWAPKLQWMRMIIIWITDSWSGIPKVTKTNLKWFVVAWVDLESYEILLQFKLYYMTGSPPNLLDCWLI